VNAFLTHSFDRAGLNMVNACDQMVVSFMFVSAAELAIDNCDSRKKPIQRSRVFVFSLTRVVINF
jgi:hypothetical protein